MSGRSPVFRVYLPDIKKKALRFMIFLYFNRQKFKKRIHNSTLILSMTLLTYNTSFKRKISNLFSW